MGWNVDSKTDLTGRKYGSWAVLGRSKKRINARYGWVCVCDCGTTRDVSKSSLTRGVSKSCGCLKGGSNAEILTFMGQSLNISEWGRFLGVSKQRAHQLKNKGRLELRIREKCKIVYE